MKHNSLQLFFPQNSDGKYWISGRSQDEALKKAVEQFGVEASKITLTQG